jgi:U3 small nucleolar RNA-associated protein 15
MAAPVVALPTAKLAPGPSSLTPEQIYWRSFKSQLVIPSPSARNVSSISQAPVGQPNSSARADIFAVTTGTRVQIYSTRTRKLVKTISRFSDVAHSGDIRSDGRLLVAGDDSGTIQAFDIGSRAILRTWHEHKQPVWVTKFSPFDMTALLSASDDRTVRLWDLPSEKAARTFEGHTDYVRAAAFMPGSPNLIISGSYDTTVLLWDSRSAERPVMTFKHSAPVESVLPMPSGTIALAAAENQISVLDIVAGRPLKLIQNHQKTITSLCLAKNGERVISGGLDGQLKVYDTDEWSVVYGAKYPSPILAISVLRNMAKNEDTHLAVGMESGLLSIRTRLSGKEKAAEKSRQTEMKALVDGTIEEHDKKLAKKRGKGWEKRTRGQDFRGEGVDVIVNTEAKKSKKLSIWELHLRKGRYGQALDEVVSGVSLVLEFKSSRLIDLFSDTHLLLSSHF